MLLYRALNFDDLNHYNNNEDICCSLVDTYNQDKNIKNVSIYYDLCINGDFKYSLDSLIGHVSGLRLGVRKSPWISTSYDFGFTASEYAVPQAGRYNPIKERKPIIIMYIDEDDIKWQNEELKLLRDKKVDRCIVDISLGRLNGYFDSGAIDAEKYNEDMPGYDVIDSINREINNYKTNVNGFSNYSFASSEVLIYNKIDKKDIKACIGPKLVDVLYSCGIDMEKYGSFIINNHEEIEEYLERIDDRFIGNNLTDILVERYDNIPGRTIEDKYGELKDAKMTSLKHAVNLINFKYNTDFKATGLLDNKVLVSNYNDINRFTTKSKNDIIVIEKDNLLYVYDHDKKGYYNQETKGIILTKDIKK